MIIIQIKVLKKFMGLLGFDYLLIQSGLKVIKMPISELNLTRSDWMSFDLSVNI